MEKKVLRQRGQPEKGMEARRSQAYFRQNKEMKRLLQRTSSDLSRGCRGKQESHHEGDPILALCLD